MSYSSPEVDTRDHAPCPKLWGHRALPSCTILGQVESCPHRGHSGTRPVSFKARKWPSHREPQHLPWPPGLLRDLPYICCVAPMSQLLAIAMKSTPRRQGMLLIRPRLAGDAAWRAVVEGRPVSLLDASSLVGSHTSWLRPKPSIALRVWYRTAWAQSSQGPVHKGREGCRPGSPGNSCPEPILVRPPGPRGMGPTPLPRSGCCNAGY